MALRARFVSLTFFRMLTTVLPVVPLRSLVMFPGVVILEVDGPAWHKLAEEIASTRVSRAVLVTHQGEDIELGSIGVEVEIVHLKKNDATSRSTSWRAVERRRIKAFCRSTRS